MPPNPPEQMVVDDLAFFSPDVRGGPYSTSPTLSKDILHLKTLLQRERQISEERLRALEHRDVLLAAADSRRKTSHNDSARRREDLSLAERRLNEERNKRAELQRVAEEVTRAIEVYKQGHADLRQKLIELIEKESRRINEHPRDLPEKTLPIHDMAPKDALSLLHRLLEKLVLFVNSSTDRQRTELLERSRARQDMSNQRIEELESRSRVLEQDLKAAQDARTDLESRLRLAESEKIQLKLENDLVRSELSNDRVTRDQNLELMKRSIEECREEISTMQSEADALRIHCATVEESETHQRKRAEALHQQMITVNAQIDFCQKHHVFSSGAQQTSPQPFVRQPQPRTPQLETALPPTQSTEIMSTSAPSSSRIDFPDPIVPPIAASQPAAEAAPQRPRRGTRARRGVTEVASSSDVSGVAGAAPPKAAVSGRRKK